MKKEIAKITGKRKRTDADHVEVNRLEFLAGLYIDDRGPFIPRGNLRKCLIEGARKSKSGKQLEQGLYVADDAVLQYEGPKDAKGMWESGEFTWSTVVGNQRASIVRTRPRFHDWQCEFEVDCDDSLVTLDILEDACRWAEKIGICDARVLGYGRFTARIVATKAHEANGRAVAMV